MGGGGDAYALSLPISFFSLRLIGARKLLTGSSAEARKRENLANEKSVPISYAARTEALWSARRYGRNPH